MGADLQELVVQNLGLVPTACAFEVDDHAGGGAVEFRAAEAAADHLLVESSSVGEGSIVISKVWEFVNRKN